MSTNITEEELAEARKIWGDALVAVSKGSGMLAKLGNIRPSRSTIV